MQKKCQIANKINGIITIVFEATQLERYFLFGTLSKISHKIGKIIHKALIVMILEINLLSVPIVPFTFSLCYNRQ
jgi:hypothetical protein